MNGLTKEQVDGMVNLAVTVENGGFLSFYRLYELCENTKALATDWLRLRDANVNGSECSKCRQSSADPVCMYCNDCLAEYVAENERLDERVRTLAAEVERLQAMMKRARHIMEFHAGRCPLNPMNNYSGMEEHLAEYRAVIRDAAEEAKGKT